MVFLWCVGMESRAGSALWPGLPQCAKGPSSDGKGMRGPEGPIWPVAGGRERGGALELWPGGLGDCRTQEQSEAVRRGSWCEEVILASALGELSSEGPAPCNRLSSPSAPGRGWVAPGLEFSY